MVIHRMARVLKNSNLKSRSKPAQPVLLRPTATVPTKSGKRKAPEATSASHIEKRQRVEPARVDQNGSPSSKKTAPEEHSIGSLPCVGLPSHSTPPTDVPSCCAPCNPSLSPKNALHVAKLKQSFLDTIFQSMNHLIPDKDKTFDPQSRKLEKETQERETLERIRLAEKAKIKTKIEAANKALHMKTQRQKDREAARMELETMKTSNINIDDNGKLIKDLESIGCSYLFEPDKFDPRTSGISVNDDGYLAEKHCYYELF